MAKKRNKLELKDFGYQLIDVSKLVKAEWNYKDDDDKKLKDLINNIKRNGQVENLIVREIGDKYEIVNGNHRYDALYKLGLKLAIVCNKGKISKEEAIRLAIETNETRFPNDNIKLAELFEVLSGKYEMEDLSKTLPFTQTEIENYQNLLSFDWDKFENEVFVEDVYNKKISITVNEDVFKRWNELKDKFKDIMGYENESKIFEFAIIEALNIPIESLK
jgi:ParB/RepB/Spo0J family partition protein